MITPLTEIEFMRGTLPSQQESIFIFIEETVLLCGRAMESSGLGEESGAAQLRWSSLDSVASEL